MQIEHVVGEQLAGLIDDGDLASSAQAGIDAQHRDGAGRRGEQQVVEIVAEDGDGVGVGTPLQFQANLALDGGVQQALPGVVDGQLELRRPVARLRADMALHKGDGALGFEFDQEVKNVFAFAAADGQHAMRRNGFHRLACIRSTS